MCFFLIPAALAIAGAAASAEAQHQQADAQSNYESNMYSQTGHIAAQNYQQTIAQTGVQGAEQAQAATNNALNNEVQGAQQLGAATTGEAAGGVQGNSVNALFSNYNRLEAANNNNIQTQLTWQQQQRTQTLAAARSGTQGQIASATPAPVAQPSAVATGLSMAASAAQGVNNQMYMSQTGPYSRQQSSSSAPDPFAGVSYNPYAVGNNSLIVDGDSNSNSW